VRYFLFILALSVSAMMAAGKGVDEIPVVQIMPRVDTAHPVVRAVLTAWLDSLDAWRRPMAMNANNDRHAVGGIVKDWFIQNERTVRSFPPTILSVEHEGDVWVVRTMFSMTDTVSGHIQPLGIVQAAFSDAAGHWAVVSPLDRATRTWPREKVGMITYVHSPYHVMDHDRTDASVRFVEDVARATGQPLPKAITYYVAKDRDELCRLLGVEYHALPPSGLAFPKEGIVMSGLGSEWYPHELVHVVLARFDDAHPVIREGVATWLGGSLGIPFDTLVDRYVEGKEPEQIPSFVALFTDPDRSQDDVYIIGAALCKVVHDTHGMEAVLRLLQARSTSDVMLLCSRYLHLDPSDQQESLAAVLHQAREQGTVIRTGR